MLHSIYHLHEDARLDATQIGFRWMDVNHIPIAIGHVSKIAGKRLAWFLDGPHLKSRDRVVRW